MATKKALIIKDGLQWNTIAGERSIDVIATIDDDARNVELKTPNDSIFISVDDLRAIIQLAMEAETAKTGSSLIIAEDRGSTREHVSCQCVETVQPESNAPWQPDWESIPNHLKFIAKDADGKVFGYKDKPRNSSIWYSPTEYEDRLKELDGRIPGDWKESLYERPE